MRSFLSSFYWKFLSLLKRWGLSAVFLPLLGPLSVLRVVLYIIRFNSLPRWRINRDGSCFISPFVCFLHPDNIHLGKGVGLAHQCYVWAGEHAVIEIGDHSLIGPGVMIVASDHITEDNKPIRLQGMKEASIFIGKNVWIGANAVVLKGVHIGDNAVIGAATVVTKDVPNNAVIVGSSAVSRKIR
jgi:acetyltransferase-like isoleucine patch superfamily enzyme